MNKIFLKLIISYSQLNLLFDQMQRLRSRLPSLKPSLQSISSIQKMDIKEVAEKTMLKITNSKSRYQLCHGKQFQKFLQARDQVLEHQFSFNFDLKDPEVFDKDGSLLESQFYIELKKSIKKFLVESISNVVSAGFKFLCKNDLGENQAKQFASKNIMVNLESVFRNTIEAIDSSPILRENINLEQLKDILIIEVDDILSDILTNLADSYPQAPASGGTPKMRQAITEVNRTDDAENDFIYNAKIEIGDYLEDGMSRTDGDYTRFIMNVINAAIQIAQNCKEDSKYITIFEKFTDFNQHLFWAAQQKPYQKMINSLQEGSNFNLDKEKRKGERAVCDKFNAILSNNYQEDLKKRQKVCHEELNNIWNQAEEGIAELKNKKQYALGQKIPATTQPFSRAQISNKQFSVRHSSILRVLSKWAQCLEDIFLSSEQYVMRRLYPFKNIKNQLINLVTSGWGQQNGAAKLVNQLNQEYKEVKRKLNEMLKTNYRFIGDILSNQYTKSFVSSINRFTQTRSDASKMNTVLVSLMLNYTNILIHHLLKAGENILTDRQEQNINLVVFRVTDLLRSKMNCRQNTFISVLKTMYLLDNSQEMRDKFKIVRIKNKLDEPTNNVMINYLFMGKVQCQLQLSIHEVKGRQKNYQAFNHFLYQLIRGKFGPISECAIMISQLDPMITACKGAFYQQKQKKSTLKKLFGPDIQKSLKPSQSNIKSPRHLKTFQNQIGIITSSFECAECLTMTANEHPEKLTLEEYHNICYRCISKKDDPGLYLKDELKEALQSIKNYRMMKYQPLQSLQREKFLLYLNTLGELTLNLVLYLPKQFKTFTVRIDSKVLSDVTEGLNFSTLDYIEISKLIEEGVNRTKIPVMLSYLFEDLNSIPEGILLKIGLTKESLTNVEHVINEFKDWRDEKNLIKTIKYKAEIIKCSKEEWKVMNKVCKELVQGQKSKEKKMMIKYKKYKHLDISNLKQITANRVQIKAIPHWIRYCRNLKVLQLEHNQLKGSISKEQLPPNLTHLNLSDNQIQSIDVSNITNLNSLNLNRNKLTNIELGLHTTLKILSIECNNLTSFDFSSNSTIKELFIDNNQFLKEVINLPPSLEVLVADKDAIINYDFSPLQNLVKLEIERGQLQREEVINLKNESIFNCWNR